MSRLKKLSIVLLPPLAAAAVFLFRKYIWALAVTVSGRTIVCRLYRETGILCPGCGGTRSFTAFMRGDMLASLRCNPLVIIGVVLAVLFYIEQAAAAFGKKTVLIPRKAAFWIVCGSLFALWCILRNFIPFLMP